MRRILILSWGLVFLDMLTFSILTPLVPTYVDRLALSDTQAGVLSSAYAWGAVIAGLPSGFLAQRIGPRNLICLGLLGLGATSLIFGWAQQITALDMARFVQGVCGAAVWSGAMSWVIGVVPDERKGAAIGTAAGAGGIGALVGPVFGAVAVSSDPRWLFTSIALIAVALCGAVATCRDVRRVQIQSVRTVAGIAASRPLVAASLLLTVPTLGFGMMLVLAPLRIDQLGGGASSIALAFIASAVVEALLGPISGHWSDQSGRQTPYVVGLVVFCIGLTLMAITDSLPVAVVVPPLCAVGGGLYISTAFANVSDAARDAGLAQSHAFALSSTSFALGLAAGSFLGGAVASVGGINAPFFVLTAVLLGLVAYVSRGRALAARLSAPG